MAALLALVGCSDNGDPDKSKTDSTNSQPVDKNLRDCRAAPAATSTQPA